MMDVDPQQPQQYTILRIKRKRTDEPLDALVVENRARKKRSPRGLNIFQFAQTVEQDAWEDEKRRKDLREQISRLAKETSNNSVEAPPSALPTAEQKPPPSIGRPPKDDPSRRYTIVKQDESGNEKPRLPTSPPKVISHKDLPPKQTDFKMYDAILYGDGGIPAPTFDSDMDKFLPMLTDYLKIHDISPPGSPSAATSAAKSSVPIPESKSQGDDYVWDVFYHRPTTLSEWNAAIANIGTLCVYFFYFDWQGFLVSCFLNLVG
ncbi:hypothetical protein PILCRDRAFT_824407 [Piloderma croceum F 1598]|uniref:Uncharacterized protein n=1 Tax=Piloderma croceum (strain F 1598) TaxID=765440 RepID=A0A0C3FEZ4_PILCF|nr:hypothetical protein PILCRDRAFT_824407 [Piloderma croceum F 1598]